MKQIISAVLMLALAIGAGLLAGCGTTGTQTAAEQLGLWCPTATAEISAFQGVSSDLSANANKALGVAAPLVATMCSPSAIAAATSGDISTFTQTVLPALTVIAVEYAALQAKGNVKAKPVMGVL